MNDHAKDAVALVELADGMQTASIARSQALAMAQVLAILAVAEELRVIAARIPSGD